MHLTRPKSSKGRSRALPAASTLQVQRTASPGSSDSNRPDRNLRSRSQPSMWPPGQLHPAAPPLSLNKYTVLPSIERRQAEVCAGGGTDKHMSTLTLSDPDLQQRWTPEELDLRTEPKPPGLGPVRSERPGSSGVLLLAIRAPCGRRFQQRFESTDTLLMVKASAEAMYGHEYGEAAIETMEVPRRSFTDMDMTLAQCGIVNRSVLCITLSDINVVQHD